VRSLRLVKHLYQRRNSFPSLLNRLLVAAICKLLVLNANMKEISLNIGIYDSL